MQHEVPCIQASCQWVAQTQSRTQRTVSPELTPPETQPADSDTFFCLRSIPRPPLLAVSFDCRSYADSLIDYILALRFFPILFISYCADTSCLIIKSTSMYAFKLDFCSHLRPRIHQVSGNQPESPFSKAPLLAPCYREDQPRN